MADGKYGRLFTQDELNRVLERVLGTVNGLGQAVPFDELCKIVNEVRVDAIVRSRFPEDEPLFLLRGQDLLAPFAVRAYAEQLYGIDDLGRGNQVDEVTQKMRLWQRENRGRVGLPD